MVADLRYRLRFVRLESPLLAADLITRNMLRRHNLKFIRAWASGVQQSRRAQYWMRDGTDLGVAEGTQICGRGDSLVARWRRDVTARLGPT